MDEWCVCCGACDSLVLANHFHSITTPSPLHCLSCSIHASLSVWMGHWWCVDGCGKSVAMKPITGHLAHTQDRKTTPWLWLSVVTMVGGCCVVVLVLVVNHTLWLCLCGGVGCGDHEWWRLALHQASHASAHCVALLLWWCPLVLLCHHQSFFLLPSCCWWWLKEWWWHLMRPVLGADGTWMGV